MIQYYFLVTLALIFTLDAVQSGPPKFDSSFETKEIDEGSTASVLCIATNDLPIKYKWYNKFGEEVSGGANSDVKTSESQGGSRLIFDPVSTSHEGIYTCTAENQHGLVSKVYEIVVNSGNVTENVTLSVEVLNVTDSSVAFLLGAANLAQSYKVEYFEKVKSNKTMLEFRGPTFVLHDLIPSGLYTFRFQAMFVSNSTSEWSRSYEVVLLPYTPEMVLRSFSDNSVQIEWSNKLDDFRRETIDGYSVSYGIMQRDTYDTWKPVQCLVNIELSKPCSGAKYTIADLSKGSYYEIRLRARTKAGYGKPSVLKVHVA